MGVTVELPNAACSLPGQLGVRKLTKRFGKMVTDVEDPRSRTSGDGETVDQLVPQDLCDIETTVAAFKITKNAAVKLACPNLDDQLAFPYLSRYTFRYLPIFFCQTINNDISSILLPENIGSSRR